ncbi:hypothetical protein QFC19_006221 [Naganishia cerealis]|uniref:Uncharacterized protein n=1 Tax=Naganishia cerealis TaxID=610337 RepID=A0ACC2VIH8_9TREE|nr:hypothetical protein QFC19_006221 [Naganishia cerealis]
MSTTNDVFHSSQLNQSVSMMPYMMYPSTSVSSNGATDTSLSASSPNQHLNVQYYYPSSMMNMSWTQANMPRYMTQMPPVKMEPMDTDFTGPPAGHSATDPVGQHHPSNNHYPSTTLYTGRFNMQNNHLSTEAPVSRQRTFPIPNFAQADPMLTPTAMSFYAWQQQQRFVQQFAAGSGQHARPSPMINRGIMHSDSGAATTMALQDAVQPQVAVPGSVSGSGHRSTHPTGVSIAAHSRPTTPFPPFPSATMGLGSNATLYAAGTAYPPISMESMSDVKPATTAVAALSLREIQGSSETNSPRYCTLQDLADSESDSDGGDDDDDEDAAGFSDSEGEEEDQDGAATHGQDESSEGEEDEDDDDEDMESTSIKRGPVTSFLGSCPPATSNVRSEPVKSSTTAEADSRDRFIPTDLHQRTSARIAKQRISASCAAFQSRNNHSSSRSTAAAAFLPRSSSKSAAKTKRTAKPGIKAETVSPTTTSKRRRPTAVTSGATCRVPNPIPNFEINKKSRGRAVTTDPNAINSNIVHVCPVPACGACFKRREHVKRHIRGLHTEDKVGVCTAIETIPCFTLTSTIPLSLMAASSQDVKAPSLEETT